MDKRGKEILRRFVESYKKVTQSDELIDQFASFVIRESQNPTPFELFHERVRSPFDYAEFGAQFIAPLIDFERSILKGKENLKAIESTLKRGENVILFANHQIEPDPQVIYLMLRDEFKEVAEKMIFVAGDRVVRDPMAIPLSLGCNLLCIYSKKYVDTPPEEKEQKLLHNKRTMGEMEKLLSQGGQIIYVAPSGGRDRMRDGKLIPAPFDPNSIEMFYLVCKQANKLSHFHTLALHTYDILPPPSEINIELGEERIPQRAPVMLHFGPEFDMESVKGEDKKLRRIQRAEALYEKVVSDYEPIL